MSYMRFIRKGTGRPFRGNQFLVGDMATTLPGFGSRRRYRVNVDVREDPWDSPHALVNFWSLGAEWQAAGFDAAGRPSFLSVEESDDNLPGYGIGLYRFTERTEKELETYTSLKNSQHYVDDLIDDYYVAQWSLVTAPVRVGLHKTRALYELSARYALASYRAKGLAHVCLGDPITTPSRREICRASMAN